MNIKYIDTPNGALIIKLNGEMDSLGCTEVRTELEQMATGWGHRVVLDLSRVSFLDSSGIGVIVFLYKRLKEKDEALEIAGVQGQPQALLKLLRIGSVIPIHAGSSVEKMSDVDIASIAKPDPCVT